MTRRGGRRGPECCSPPDQLRTVAEDDVAEPGGRLGRHEVGGLVAHLPEVSFVLVGPDDRARNMLRPAKNLFLLGARPYGQLPGYLQHAAVGLIPFDVVNHRDLVRSIHPLKLYEYLASGLPVVAVEWEELHHLRSPAVLTNGREHFVAAIREAIARPPEPSVLQSYAANKDWSRIVQRMIDLVGLS